MDDVTLSVHSLRPETQQQAGLPGYVLLIEGDTSRTFLLPDDGEVLVGRGDDVQIRLTDRAASRRHARLSADAGGVKLADLDSHNGTFVNGARLTGSCPLLVGDVVTIGEAALLLQRRKLRVDRRPLFDNPRFRQRAEEEVERACHYARPLSLLCLDLGSNTIDPPALARALTDKLRIIDVAGLGGTAQLFCLLPETDAATAEATAQQQLADLLPRWPKVRAGVATCPEDGADLDTLLASARDAAGKATAAQVLGAAGAVVIRRLGDASAVLADPAMLRLYELIDRLGRSEIPVLFCGETGTGKELATRALHAASARCQRAFTAVNCATIPNELLESELFGHRRGAFSGAVEDKKGLFESASGGTLFLDEVGELSAAAQAKLLRVLETKRLLRVGDTQERSIDVRIVVATHRDLREEIRGQRFRPDLYYRLCAATVMLPPLRDRRRELPILARTFLRAACAQLGRAGAGSVYPSYVRAGRARLAWQSAGAQERHGVRRRGHPGGMGDHPFVPAGEPNRVRISGSGTSGADPRRGQGAWADSGLGRRAASVAPDRRRD